LAKAASFALALSALTAVVAPCFARGPRAHVARRSYASYVRKWHAPVPDKSAPVDEHGRTELALYVLNTGERAELPVLAAGGGFSPRELDAAAHVLREPSSGNEHPIEPRLLDAIYRIQVHFNAQEIRVISGYRTPRAIAGRRSSNHGRGRAMDIVVPGVGDIDVARFARGMGFMGVGVYPTSGFVHVDVRDRSYFWIDYSGPGRRNRERGILADVAKKADRDAVSRGEKGLWPERIAADVDALLGGHVAPAVPMPEEDED
jgi:uncharacterized protein YcbK (DUF882 family)